MSASPRAHARNVGVWAAAACLPVLSHGASLVVNLEPSAWVTRLPLLRGALAADALLYTAGCAIVAAPLAGVGVVWSRRTNGAARTGLADGLRTAFPLVVAVLLFAATSSLLTFGWTAGQDHAVEFVAQSHVTLLAVLLGLAAWGAFWGSSCGDPLDAAAVSLVTALVAAGGLLVAGATVADLSRPMIAIGLTASPLVVIASAAHIDIVRMDLLYQISPLAHVQIDYPAWETASAWYVALALLCFLGLTLKFRTRPSVSNA